MAMSAGDDDDGRGRKRARKSRWDTTDDANNAVALTTSSVAPPPGMFGTGPSAEATEIVLPDAAAIHAHLAAKGVLAAPVVVPKSDDPEVMRRFAKFQDVNQRLATRDFRDEREESDRSPSPPPKYNKFGVKVNTREARMKDKLYRERDELVEWLMANCAPGEFTPPVDWRPRKKERKLYVPEDEYPGYNFIGLILGPRGNTQKRMERETNTRIMLRGKGSVKPGAHRDHKTDYKEDEPLHVVILGETWEGVDAAAEMVGHILRPIDEEENVHKRMQLRELASINGTFVESFGACRFCGQQGHVQANCPEREAMESASYRAPVELVTCKICGDGGHPTRDCPLAGKSADAGAAATNEMNQEYTAFLNEIGVSKGDLQRGGANSAPATTSVPPPPQQQSRFGDGAGASSSARMPSMQQGGGYNHAPNYVPQPVRPGDWICEPCGYHNYANNVVCKRRGCGNSRPPDAGPGGGGMGAHMGGGFGGGGGGFGGPPPNMMMGPGPGAMGGAPLRRAPPPPPPVVPVGLQQQMGGYVAPPYTAPMAAHMAGLVPPPPPEDGSAGVPPPPPEDGSAGLPPPPAAMTVVVPPPPPVRVAPMAVPANVPPPPMEEPEEGELGYVPPPPADAKEAEFASFMDNLV